MNTINKQFNTILTSPNKNLKRQICLDICQSITEYGESIVFILQNIYKMLGTDNRNLAWMIIRALRTSNLIVVKHDYDFSIKETKDKANGPSYSKRKEYICIKKENIKSELLPQTRVVLVMPEQVLSQIDNLLFLGATSKDYTNGNLDLATQKKEVSKIAGIDERFLKVELIEDSDIAAKSNIKAQGSCKQKDFTIENVVDFFDAIMRDLTDSEWGKRHGAFGTLVEIFSGDEKEENLDYIPIDKDGTSKSVSDERTSLSTNEEVFDEMNISPDLLIKQVTLDRSNTNFIKNEGNVGHEDNSGLKIIKYRLPTTMMNTIVQVLYSDKFCDFTTDQILLPVREMAGTLMKHVFNHEFDFIDRLISFLSNTDWQIKCGCLITLHKILIHLDENRQKELCNILTDLLETKDEDIIFYCAEILSELGSHLDLHRVKTICCESFSDGNELAIGKKNIFKLLTSVFNRINSSQLPKTQNDEALIDLPGNTFTYFRSPIGDVRSSIIEMTFVLFPHLNADSKNKTARCLIESVLLEDDTKLYLRSIEALRIIVGEIPSETLKHYLDIISSDIHKGYSVEDFLVQSENLLFSDSGVKLIGKEDILKARIGFFKIILEYLYNLSGSQFDNVKSGSNVTLNDHSISFYSPEKHVSIFTINDFRKTKRIYSLIFYNLTNLFYKFPKTETNPLNFFLSVPQGEFNKCILDRNYSSHMPSVNENVVLYFRLRVSLDCTESNIIYLLERETCRYFVGLIGYIAYINKIITLKLLHSIYSIIIQEQFSMDSPVIYFFESFDITMNKDFMVFLYSDGDNTNFLSKVSPLLKVDIKNHLSEYFPMAIQRKAFPLIRYFIKEDFYYMELLIEYLLVDLDPQVLSNTIDLIDFSYYFLMVKPLLKKISDPVLSKVFSHIAPYLSINKIHRKVKKYRKEIAESIESINGLFSAIDYKIYVDMTVKLRDYQKKAVSWMHFLKEYGINGVLADDMGLGKTVMVLAFLTNEIYKIRNNTENQTRDNETQVLILTPGSLTGHWENEIKTKFPSLTCDVYRKKKTSSDVLIASFDHFRYDHLHFVSKEYFYLIIDEGHVLRNRETLLYKRLKGVKTQHKLILTGTPVQNSVDDIFSLFNFLIPNFLGTEAEFNKSYTSVIAHAREQRATERDQQKCEEVLTKLRKTVGPFILRRLKSDVLKDLPPKVVTDIILEFDEVERDAYEGYGQADSAGYGRKGFGKIIDILKVCSHKSYILSKKIESEEGFETKKPKNLLQDVKVLEKNKKIKKDINLSGQNLSTKIKAVFDIVNLCGDTVMTHKIIIFAQFRSTIDFILQDLKDHKPYIKTSRIDGSTKPELRAKIAHAFNTSDTHILLTTTATGGLGLNLTGADTVIMYEHDWNPFNDLQAMDRAHRIGQKKTVNVYRLIVRDTMEQSIMNLQNFKLFVSSKIVDSKNEEWDVGDVVGKLGGMD